MICESCGQDVHCPGCDVCPRCLEPLIYDNEYDYDEEEYCPIPDQLFDDSGEFNSKQF